MTPLEGETAILALAIQGLAGWVLLGIGRLGNATRRRAQTTAGGAAEAAPSLPAVTTPIVLPPRDPASGRFLAKAPQS
jgi:hypothetical protein